MFINKLRVSVAVGWQVDPSVVAFLKSHCTLNIYMLTSKNVKVPGHFTVVCSVAKLLIWSEAEGDLVVRETSI